MSHTFRLVDIGINLSHDSFDADREAVVQRAWEAGVHQFVITGSSVEGSERAIELARELDRERPGAFFATAGVHPHHAKDFDPAQRSRLMELARLEESVAVGECGLDFYRNFSPPAQQETVFHIQLELAAELSMPVFLHQRDAHDRFVGILREHLESIPRGVAHCFTGGQKELDYYLDLGLFIGITGWICDERRGEHLEDLVRHIPLDRLMIETDAPYLRPRDLDPVPPGRRNEPVYLPHILAKVARCMGRDREEVAARTTANAREFFGLPDAG